MSFITLALALQNKQKQTVGIILTGKQKVGEITKLTLYTLES